jgi:hypothetical protein
MIDSNQRDRDSAICPKCGNGMTLCRVVPRVDAMPALTAFRCSPCGEALTYAEDEREPIRLDLLRALNRSDNWRLVRLKTPATRAPVVGKAAIW